MSTARVKSTEKKHNNTENLVTVPSYDKEEFQGASGSKFRNFQNKDLPNGDFI